MSPAPPRPRPAARRLPARVYWVRRVVALVAVATVGALAVGAVLGLAHLLGAWWGGEPEQAKTVVAPAGTGPSTPSAPSAAPSADGKSPQPRGGKGGKKSRGPAPLPPPQGDCDPADVRVTPTVQGAYAATDVTVPLVLTTISSPACLWAVHPESLVLRITSGDDRVWTSQDCPGSIPRQTVVVRRDTSTTIDVAWHGLWSDDLCSRSTQWARPGWYHAQAASVGGEVADQQFQLTVRPAEVITKTPKPRPEPTPEAEASPTGETAEEAEGRTDQSGRDGD